MSLHAAMTALIAFGAARYQPRQDTTATWAQPARLVGWDDDEARIVELVLDAEDALLVEVELAGARARRDGRFVPRKYAAEALHLDGAILVAARCLRTAEGMSPLEIAQLAAGIQGRRDRDRRERAAGRVERARSIGSGVDARGVGIASASEEADDA